MIIKLQNQKCTVLIDTLGAQIVSFSNGERDLFYDGALNSENEENTWKRTAPRLNNPGPHDKTFQYKGKTYTRSETQHGPLRNQDFTVEEQTENYALLTYTQEPNDEFPFASQGMCGNQTNRHSKAYSIWKIS